MVKSGQNNGTSTLVFVFYTQSTMMVKLGQDNGGTSLLVVVFTPSQPGWLNWVRTME